MQTSEDEVRERAATFVRALGVATANTPAARWIEPVCPKVTGISERQALLVETAVRDHARELGVKIADAGCKANINVGFTVGAATLVEKIRKRRPALFAGVSAISRPALFAEATPIRWWYSTEVRGRDGDRLSDAPSPSILMEGGGTPPSGKMLNTRQASIISTNNARALRGATIIVDADRMKGASLASVADYVSLVALAEIKLGTDAAPESILALFDPVAPVVSLTEWDRTFIRELYRLPLDRPARYQQRRLTEVVVDNALSGSQGPDRPQTP